MNLSPSNASAGRQNQSQQKTLAGASGPSKHSQHTTLAGASGPRKHSQHTTLAGASGPSKSTRKKRKTRPARAVEPTGPSNVRPSEIDMKPKDENIPEVPATDKAPSTAQKQLQNANKLGVTIFNSDSNINEHNVGGLVPTAVQSAKNKDASQHTKELEEMGITMQEHPAHHNDTIPQTVTTALTSESAVEAAALRPELSIDEQKTLIVKGTGHTTDVAAAVMAETSKPDVLTEASDNDPLDTSPHANQLSELGIETDVNADLDIAVTANNDSSSASGEFLEF